MESAGQNRENGFRAAAVTVVGCLLYLVSSGIRGNLGITVGALASYTGLSYAGVSLAMAVGQLMYGVTQPLFGLLALKKSNTAVLLAGAALMLSGLFLTPFASSQGVLTLALGVLFSSGTGALSFGIIMGAVSPLLGRNRASAVSGIINASSGIGSSLFSPLLQWMQGTLGVGAAFRILCLPAAALIPAVIWMRRLGETTQTPSVSSGTPGSLLRQALADPDYRRLLAGFGTCGFHMSIIQTHSYAQIVSYGFPETMAALGYTLFGIATMVGSVLCGVACQRFLHRRVLGLLYGSRAVMVLSFLFLLPKNPLTVLGFMAGMGLTGAPTVTPTSEIIRLRFGAASLGLLFGFTFVTHQIGGFLSSWLGGILIGEHGNYVSIWCVDAALCALAAFVSFRIRMNSTSR